MPKLLNVKSKRKKHRNAPFSLSGERRKNKKKQAPDPNKIENIRYIRHLHHVTKANGDKFRMSFMLDASKIKMNTTNTNTTKLNIEDTNIDSLFEQCNELSPYRKVQEVTQTTPEKGLSPNQVIVISPSDPKKMIKMRRIIRSGPASIFVEEDPAYIPVDKVKPIKTLDQSNPLFTSEAYQATKLPTSDIKHQDATFTAESIKKVIKKPSRDQNAVMTIPSSKKKISAQQYADATKAFPSDVKFEWVHMLPYASYGEPAQKKKNLFCGTKQVNTWMTTIEGLINSLANLFEKEGITINATVNLIPGTHIGIDLKYIVQTPVVTLEFDFNCQETNESHVSFAKAITALIKHVTGLAEKQNINKKNINQTNQNSSNQTSKLTTQRSLFFKTKKDLDEAAKKAADANNSANSTQQNNNQKLASPQKK